jgi:predicted nucleic acid-binding protein
VRRAVWFDNVPQHYILARDPDDSVYLNLAITAGAPFVVTTDLDLLELMDKQSQAGNEFRAKFPAIQVVEPTEFERQVNAKSP